MIEAYDILSLHCELLNERIKLIQLTKECPPDLVSCIATLVYAATRVDGIPELLTIRQQFLAKYGTTKFEFDTDNTNNANYAVLSNSNNSNDGRARSSIVNERVVTKLSIQPPAAYLVQTYLEQICEKYDVDWSPMSASSSYPFSQEQMGTPSAPPTGYSIPIGKGTGLGPKFMAHSGMTVNGDEDDTHKDDDDDDDDDLPPPLPPHHPYTAGLPPQSSRTTNATRMSLPNPDVPAGGGDSGAVRTNGGIHSSSATSTINGHQPSAPVSSFTIPEAPSSFNKRGKNNNVDSATPSTQPSSSIHHNNGVGLASAFYNVYGG